MKRFALLIAAVILSVAASAQVSSLGGNMEVSNPQAWDAFAAKMKEIHKHRPVVALVLGGGGAKGTAHVGVLKYLEEIKMPVDMVIGTSMGGLMGSMFSLGYTAEQIDSVVTKMDWPTMMSDKVPEDLISFENRKYKEKYILDVPFEFAEGKFKRSMPSAYINGQNVSNLISSLTVGYQDDMKFCDLPIPFACVATDLIAGKGLVWVDGSLTEALRTTMSIPVVFSPIRKDGKFLVDGGMMDNFPADVAKALGADIIIGVSVDTPSKGFEDAYNVLDVVSLAIDLSGKTRLADTFKLPDLLLRPDLEGLGPLSFSTENVKTLVANGYKAACDSAAVFAGIRERVGSDTLMRHAPAAKSLIWDKVKIGRIKVNGLDKKEVATLIEDFNLRPGQMVDKTILDDKVSRLYSTGAFKGVKYNLFGKNKVYNLVMDCEKGPLHRFGLGVRFDTEEMVSAVANVGFLAHSLYGSRLDLTLRLSANPYAKVEYSFNLPRFPRICLAVDARYADSSLMRFADSPFDMNYFMSNQEISLADFTWIKFNLRGGLRNTVARVSECSYASPLVGVTTVYSGAYISGKMDKLAGGYYFPVDGVALHLDYSWQFKSNLKQGERFHHHNYHDAKLSLMTATTPVPWFTFLFDLDARMLFSPNHDNIPLYAMNIIGGDIAGRYFTQQVAFSSLNNAYALHDAMIALHNDFRFKFLEKQYVTASVQAALSNKHIYDRYDVSSFDAFVDNHLTFGAALEYSISTFLGPVKANVHWSNINRRNERNGFGFYFSAGFNF